MKRGQLPLGYTILESMIFFVVTGILLASALLLFNGQQNRTRFTQGLREMDSSINGLMNEVSSGYYPSTSQLNCGFFGVVPFVIDSGGDGQGTNEDCIFLGKSMQFLNDGYIVNTIVGRRLETDNRTQVQTLEDPDGPGGSRAGAQPSLANGFAPGVANLSDRRSLPATLEVYDMYQVRGGVSSNIASVAFVFSLAAYQSGSSDPVSGAQSVSVIGVDGTSFGNNAPQEWMDTRDMQDADRNTDQVVICFTQSGGGGRKAAIVIGGQGKELSTQVINDAVVGTEPGRQCS